MAGGQPEARPFRKGGMPEAGSNEENGNKERHENGEPARADMPGPQLDRANAEVEKDQEGGKRNGEPGEAHGEIGHGDEGGDVFHDAVTSFALTLALVMPLAVCALGPQTAGWQHIAVAGGYYCFLFGFSCWAARRWGAASGGVYRTAFRESRLAIVVIGVAAVGFRSPALLAIAPDVLAVAIATSGYADGLAVGLLARWRGCSSVGALWTVMRIRDPGANSWRRGQ